MNERPNILFMMPDQLRADFLGCYGAGFAKTPHLDELAATGTRFERCLSPNPICVPARASLLTGQTSIESGIMANDQWLRPDRRDCGVETWPELLSQAGYHTYGVGKMHFTPWDASEGFQTRVIAEDKRHTNIQDDYNDYLTSIGQQKIHGREMEGYVENAGACYSPLIAEQHVDNWAADRAIDLLAAHDTDQPFAMMIGFPSPHCPYDPPVEIADLFDPEDMPAAFAATRDSEALRPWLVQNMKNPWADLDYSEFTKDQVAKVRAHYSALIYMLDQAVGRILKSLQQTGLAENTVIVFSSDHGDFVGDFGLVCKNFFMEGSVRVPLILRRPGQDPEVRHDTVTLSDLYPTFLGLAGVEPRSNVIFRDLLKGPPIKDRVVYGATHRGFFVERSRMKLARYVDGLVTLYDIGRDPQEQHNLVGKPECAGIQAELDALLTEWQVEQSLAAHGEKRIEAMAENKVGVGAMDPTRRGWLRAYPYNPLG